MKKNYPSPEAYIAIGKNRQKVYGETVYLSDKQEFEFEFFNSTNDNIMAKISINGKLISNRGLILRPGVRGWIERYIDENRKFLFETYTVDGKSEAVKKAIENNGDVKIEFFREKQKPEPQWQILDIWKNKKFIGNPYRDDIIGTYNTCCGDNSTEYKSTEYNSRGILSRATLDSSFEDVQCNTRSFCSMPKAKLSKKVETGRVEKGSTSDQHFNYVDMDFEYFPFHAVNYKLMPLSAKPVEFNENKLKCAHCNAKIKSNWKVCPICAHPINDECKCPGCSLKVETAWNVCPNCGTQLK